MRNIATEPAERELARPLDNVSYRRLDGLAYAFKGLLDRLLAGIALIILAVPMLVIAILVKRSSPGPVLVKQVRVGRYGKPFTFFKFRSMREDAEQVRDELEQHNNHDTPTIFKIRRDPRTTRLGSVLRRTSLDELPNLFNVVRGEMSLIGPRPPLPREVAHYEPRHLQRLTAMPGITGLWQVRGRSELPFEEMVELDLKYIEDWSLALDLLILIRTPFVVLSGRGAW